MSRSTGLSRARARPPLIPSRPRTRGRAGRIDPPPDPTPRHRGGGRGPGGPGRARRLRVPPGRLRPCHQKRAGLGVW
ncbi:MAG TPA: hypothetical protein VFF52_04880, partial [Isosphaeraceae bacterium]|nr:hypothetical protein [Isosphaeraceae bacterium]